jgi:hypothetical protein
VSHIDGSHNSYLGISISKPGEVCNQISPTVLVKVSIKKHVLSTRNHECITAELRKKIIGFKKIRNPQFLVKSNSST